MKWATLTAGLLAILLWLFFRPKSTTTTIYQSVESKLGGFVPTQLGAPVSVIQGLSYQQLQRDVAYWIDPSSGLLIANVGNLLDGSLPVVALTDANQIVLFAQKNPVAIADLVSNQALHAFAAF
jgi:hypothetical protein